MTGTKPTTPVARYFHQEAQRRGYVLDAAQGNAILHLDRLAERLRSEEHTSELQSPS